MKARGGSLSPHEEEGSWKSSKCSSKKDKLPTSKSENGNWKRRERLASQKKVCVNGFVVQMLMM